MSTFDGETERRRAAARSERRRAISGPMTDDELLSIRDEYMRVRGMCEALGRKPTLPQYQRVVYQINLLAEQVPSLLAEIARLRARHGGNDD